MCGYCIEKYVFYFIESSRAQATVELEDDLIWLYGYLKECEDLVDIISKIKTFANFQEVIDIVFYRLFDEFITNGYNKQMYDYIKSAFNNDSIKNFFDKNNECHEYSIWNELGNQDIYEDKKCWDALMLSNQNFTTKSVEILEMYRDWWLFGKNKQVSDPNQRMEKTGIMDPIDNTTPRDWKRFYSIFPDVFFSLSILLKYQPNSDVIRHIALNNPYNTPDFLGYDLWLQRKAFDFCVKAEGIGFIVNSLYKIRFELIIYILLKRSFEVSELKILKKAMEKEENQFPGEEPYFGTDRHSVLKLINQLIDQPDQAPIYTEK